MTALFVGGAEKQYRYIMEALSEKYKVHVLLLNQPLKGEESRTKKYIESHRIISFYQLNGNALNEAKKGKIQGIIGKIRALVMQWLWLKKYVFGLKIDATMFTYVTQLLMVPLLRRMGIRIVFNERNTGRQICDREFKVGLLHKCDKVICNSEFASKYIEEMTGINVTVLKNGIEIKPCLRKEHEGFNILVPARISPIKNQMIVAKALERLKTLLNEDEIALIRCTFAGSCEFQEYKTQLENEIKEHDLNIELTGFIGNMDELYATSDLVILPSYEEGTPNVLLEAYMNRIDVLASDIPMNRVCCTDDGILFSPDDDMELAQKIVGCYRTHKTQEFYDKNYNYLIDNYGINEMKRNYILLFDRLLGLEERR